jgi:hypothetical protein
MRLISRIAFLTTSTSETPCWIPQPASAQVLSSAQSLSTESNKLKLEVQKFLETVRAA